MALFVKKPIAIQAEQYRDSGPLPFVEERALDYDEDRHCQVIRTLEGEMVVTDGDWIIRGVNGEYYPCKLDIFEQSYAPVVQADAPQPDDDGLAPEFTVYIVRRGQRFPMVIDSLFVRRELAEKRAALLGVGQGWHVDSYSHLTAARA